MNYFENKIGWHVVYKKVLPLQAQMALWEGRGIALPFLDCGIRRG
jgi:hypothetical protein